MVVYDEKNMGLAPIAFFKSLHKHKYKIRELEYELCKSETIKLMAFQALAFKIEKEPITDFDKKEIFELIRYKYLNMTFDELYYAFKLERFGELGDKTSSYGRLDASFISIIIDKYRAMKTKVLQNNNIEIQKPKLPEMTAEQKRLMVQNGVLECYDQYFIQHKIIDGKLYVYDLLYDLELLPHDPDVKRQVYKQAVEQLKTELALYRPKDLEQSRMVKAQITQLEQKGATKAVIRAKHISIINFFKNIEREQLIKILNEWN